MNNFIGTGTVKSPYLSGHRPNYQHSYTGGGKTSIEVDLGSRLQKTHNSVQPYLNYAFNVHEADQGMRKKGEVLCHVFGRMGYTISQYGSTHKQLRRSGHNKDKFFIS